MLLILSMDQMTEVVIRSNNPSSLHIYDHILIMTINNCLFLEQDFGTDDPRWIGCWWLGFVICSIGSLVWAIPISFFPEVIKRKPVKDAEKDKEQDKEEEEEEDEIKKIDITAQIKGKLYKKRQLEDHSVDGKSTEDKRGFHNRI